MSRQSLNENLGPINRWVKNDNGRLFDSTQESDWPENAKQFSATLVGKVESMVQARPLTCLGIAAGLGVLAAFWSKRK